MPELPELEVVCEVLNRRVIGKLITEVKTIPPGGPIVVRDLTGKGFESSLVGRTITSVRRRGKFLIFSFNPNNIFLVINPKLTGRLQLSAHADKRAARTHVIISFEGGMEVRYFDQKRMGQVYLCRDLESVPDYALQGPEPLDISEEEFRVRLKPFQGEIKGILTRGQFVAGIGNAYADEILWAARIHPYRKRSTLSAVELGNLFEAMRITLTEDTVKVRKEMGESIHLKPRDFMNIHMKAGQACPRCGGIIAEITANQRITNFCRNCQPGGLIKGMGS